MNGPLKRACSLVLVREATPARWEWVYWTSGAWRQPRMSNDGTILGGVGAEITTGLLSYAGFPSGPYGRRLGRAELRVGPWMQALAGSRRDAIEGGIKLHLGAAYHASFGTYDIRMGLGYGTFVEHREPYASITFAYGIRSALSRYSEHGPCDPVAMPRGIATASVVRLFVSYRRPILLPSGDEVLFGLELSPTFLLPPYSWFRLGGGPSR